MAFLHPETKVVRRVADRRKLLLLVFILACVSSTRAQQGQRVFLQANIAISEGRFQDAHALAEKLIEQYAGDCHIGLYLHLYVHSFYLLDDDFRKGMLHPTPTGMQARIDAMKAKSDKREIDLVKLVMVANGLHGGFGIEYLEELLEHFPDSAWRDWAEWMLIREAEYRPNEKYQDRSPEERSALLMRDLYQVGKKFIAEHPDSYMLPSLLEATASWTCWGYKVLDKQKKREVMSVCYRVLNEYPSADYQCARAREILRDLLGSDYKESEECSKEKDRIITLFYCHSPDLYEYKRDVAAYVSMKERMAAETQPEPEQPRQTQTDSSSPSSQVDGGLSVMGVVGSIGVAIAAGVVLVVLLRKKPSAK